ncbi:MAG: efflux RND transporter permease subunit [Candidatus Hydrogenedentes bacterium]|nr:efflux RND transporter permease subunit [Candidatus Hydrogenedentota bacterium]
MVIRNSVLVNVMMIMLLVAGALAANLMIREVFPRMSVDVLTITVLYPGADPEEVEEGISRKIEEAIDGIEGIKRYTTTSAENISVTAIEVQEGRSVDDVYTDVRNAIDSISTFPVTAEKPILSEITIMTEVMILAVAGNQPERVMKEFAEEIKDELQALPSVSQVAISGTRDYEIAIEISEDRLREYGLTFNQVAAEVRRGSLNLSGGVMRTQGEEIRLRTVGRKYTGEDFASIVVLARADGDVITLGQIADVKDGFTEDAINPTFNGEPAVLISISKTPSEDSIAIAEEVDEYLAQKLGELPAGLTITKWSDQSVNIRANIDLLVRNGLIGLTIVFFALWFMLDLRLSFWVSLGIPVSLSGAMFVMLLLGASLNMMSLFGLIMVLGIVVDDAIVVGEAIYVARKRGDPPLLAAVNGVREVGMPVLAAVTTTIIAFLPLMFVGGVMGKFVGIIPVAVISALLFSLLESLFLLPSHLSHLPGPDHVSIPARMSRSVLRGLETLQGLRRLPLVALVARMSRRVLRVLMVIPTATRHRITSGTDWFVERMYLPFVTRALHFRYVALSVAIAILMITVGMTQGGFVKFEVFTQDDSNDVVANIEFPRGTPIEITERATRETEAALLRVVARLPRKDEIPLIRNVYTITGQGMSGSANDFGGPSFGNHTGAIRVELADSDNRLILAQDLLVEWEKEVGPIPGAITQDFSILSNGPPGAPINITLKGEDMDTLLAVSGELKAKLHTYEGIYQISDSFRPGKNEMRFDLKPEARALGLNLEDLASQVYAGFYGQEALRLQRGRDDIRVKVRYTEDQRSRLALLEQVRIRTPQGHEVPFYSVAEVSFAQGYSAITRIDGKKSVTVTAQNDPRRINADAVITDLNSGFMDELDAKYSGYTWSFDGPQKDARDAFSTLFIGLPVAMIGVFIIIASVFRSYVQPFVIMFTIPFGIIGAIWGHYALGLTMTMFSTFGMVALTGVVVNDAIVLIEAINKTLARGVPVFEAIVQGGKRRFRAIFLTSLSTVGGLAPLIMETDMQIRMVKPMAVSLAAGVAFATILTLVFIPCLLGVLNDFRRVVFWLLHGYWPTREEVEPARLRNRDPLLEEDAEPVPAK